MQDIWLPCYYKTGCTETNETKYIPRMHPNGSDDLHFIIWHNWPLSHWPQQIQTKFDEVQKFCNHNLKGLCSEMFVAKPTNTNTHTFILILSKLHISPINLSCRSLSRNADRLPCQAAARSCSPTSLVSVVFSVMRMEMPWPERDRAVHSSIPNQ
jgi:hypothetical protein